MGKFLYSAVNIHGKEIRGVIEAETKDDAICKIKSRDLFPVSVKDCNTPPAKPEAPLPRYFKESSDVEESTDPFLSITNKADNDWVLSAIAITVLLSSFVLAFFLDWKYREWQTKRIIKQVVQEESLYPKYRNQ